jgi:hypothetical protein
MGRHESIPEHQSSYLRRYLRRQASDDTAPEAVAHEHDVGEVVLADVIGEGRNAVVVTYVAVCVDAVACHGRVMGFVAELAEFSGNVGRGFPIVPGAVYEDKDGHVVRLPVSDSRGLFDDVHHRIRQVI